MSLRMSILGLVSYKEMSGYDIYKLFDGSLKFFFSAQQSQIYRELNALLVDGYVTQRREEQDSRPTKKLFSITPAGEEALFNWLVDYGEEPHFAQRLPYLSKVFFAAKIPDEELLHSIKRFRELAEIKRARLQQSYQNVDGMLSAYEVPSNDFFYWELTVDFGFRIFNMYIEWADHSIALLQERLKKQSD